MTDADLPFVGALYASTRFEELAATGWPDSLRDAFLEQQHRAQHQHYMTHYSGLERMILEVDGEAVGRLYLVEWEREYRIVDISLAASHRGRGIGAAIFSDLMAAASDKAKNLSIHVEKNNPARRLYEWLGFEVAADKGIYELMKWRPPRGGAGGQ